MELIGVAQDGCGTRLSPRPDEGCWWPAFQALRQGAASIGGHESGYMMTTSGEPRREVLATTDGLRVQLVTVSRGQRIPWHQHTVVSDTIVAVSGVVDIELSGAQHRELQPGQRWTIPPQTPHTVSGLLGEPCAFVNLHSGGDYDFQPLSTG